MSSVNHTVVGLGFVGICMIVGTVVYYGGTGSAAPPAINNMSASVANESASEEPTDTAEQPQEVTLDDDQALAAIPGELIDMEPATDENGGTAIALSTQTFSTVGTSVDTEWLATRLAEDDTGISVGLKLVQPQMWYYAIVHHSCKNPRDYRWEKFWTAAPDAGEGEIAIGDAAVDRANEEGLDNIGSLIFTKLCSG